MAEHLTGDEVEQKLLAAMGPALGGVFTKLWNEFVWLHWKWATFVALFGTNEQRIDVLNSASPTFFVMLQRTLWDDSLLHLARLVDNPTVSGRDTLTLQGLPGLVRDDIRPNVKQLMADVLERTKFAKDWRNRHIGHRELALALKEATQQLTPASREHVKGALDSIGALLNFVEGQYDQVETAFGWPAPTDGAERLLYLLRDGLEAREELRARLQAREPSAIERLRPRPL